MEHSSIAQGLSYQCLKINSFIPFSLIFFLLMGIYSTLLKAFSRVEVHLCIFNKCIILLTTHPVSILQILYLKNPHMFLRAICIADLLFLTVHGHPWCTSHFSCHSLSRNPTPRTTNNNSSLHIIVSQVRTQSRIYSGNIHSSQLLGHG